MNSGLNTGTKRSRKKTIGSKKPPAVAMQNGAAPAEAKSNSVRIKVTAAKGRPMLQWVGKRPLTHVIGFPAQLIEVFDPFSDEAKQSDSSADWPAQYSRSGLLFYGDNKEVLTHLLANGFRNLVGLIFIDPPFDSAADYVRRVTLRGTTAKIEGEAQSLGEQIQYSDLWAVDSYLQFMYERLTLLKELLSPERGFIFVQCDHRKSHHLRCVMDEIFGPDNFRNEIASRRGTTSVQAQFEKIDALVPAYYTTLLYSRSADAKLPVLRRERVSIQPGKWDTLWRNHDRPTMRYELFGTTPKEGQWRWSPRRARQAVANFRKYEKDHLGQLDLDNYIIDHHSATGEILDFIRQGPDKTVQCYIPPQWDRLANNVWMDFPHMGTVTDYPTEKPEEMLRRAIDWTSSPGDIVLDCFVGSGTTPAVAQKLGRRWIGCDINKGAIQTTSKRLQSIIFEQHQKQSERQDDQPELIAGFRKDSNNIKPAQLSFAVHRVNDYDLAIQHNEAVNLACEHIGVERIRTDSYFDGRLGDAWVKIIPFGHPLSPTDLEELKRELDARQDDPKLIKIVCLGMELAARTWVEEWNKLRKGKQTVNRIEVIELRTDPKYGKFIAHNSAKARVSIRRTKEKIHVEINDFISPTIVERLQQQGGILKPKIDDWRAMVDCVMIDTVFNGEVFNVVVTDIPERKTDFVQGSYELDAPKDKTTVAVKIIDMLGEEVITTATV